MPRSMTAFARQTLDFTWGSVSCELRSVNHRFLEPHFKLPETIRDIEMVLRDIARKKLSRGKIDCSIQIAFNNTEGTVNADLELAKRYISIAEQLATQISEPAQISPLEIMRWPGVLKDQNIESESLHKGAIETFKVAVVDLLEGRMREGEKLAIMIDEAQINTLTVAIMQVPCCNGLLGIAQEAASRATRKIPIKLVVLSLQGDVLREEWV